MLIKLLFWLHTYTQSKKHVIKGQALIWCKTHMNNWPVVYRGDALSALPSPHGWHWVIHRKAYSNHSELYLTTSEMKNYMVEYNTISESEVEFNN